MKAAEERTTAVKTININSLFYFMPLEKSHSQACLASKYEELHIERIPFIQITAHSSNGRHLHPIDKKILSANRFQRASNAGGKQQRHLAHFANKKGIEPSEGVTRKKMSSKIVQEHVI